jgi:hypothetical protein
MMSVLHLSSVLVSYRKHLSRLRDQSAYLPETTLRQVVGGRVLQAVISDREGLAQEVAEIVSCPTPSRPQFMTKS